MEAPSGALIGRRLVTRRQLAPHSNGPTGGRAMKGSPLLVFLPNDGSFRPGPPGRGPFVCRRNTSWIPATCRPAPHSPRLFRWHPRQKGHYPRDVATPSPPPPPSYSRRGVTSGAEGGTLLQSHMSKWTSGTVTQCDPH